MILYMEVTSDKYELPIAIAESPRELARMTNTKSNIIRSAICHGKESGRVRSKYVKLEVEDDND